MKNAFKEDYIFPHVDPLAPTHAEFDLEEVERLLGEAPADPRESSEIITRIFDYVTKGVPTNKNTDRMMGRRFAALAWVLNPSLFDGISGSKLAEALGIKSKRELYILTGEASRHFGITNRAQAHAWNRGGKHAD